MYVRIVKVRSSNGTVNEYVRIVESFRQDGKVKQRVVADLGRKDVLAGVLPQLQRLLQGQGSGDAQPDVAIAQAATWGPVLLVRALFERLGLWPILQELLGASGDGWWADRAFVVVANRLICPKSEHGLARWLESAWVCDRQGRRFVPHWKQRRRVQVDFGQLKAWYTTLDRLLAAKSKIEVRLYGQLRDLFSLQPDLVLYDVTSTYFEGEGPEGLAKHGYSRDGKPQNVQVVVGLVLVGGWPIAHHVWEGNRLDVTTVREVLADLQQRFALQRVLFVGDRGMVSEVNLEELLRQGHDYLVGLKRRRHAKLDVWLQGLRDDAWQECPMGVNVQERHGPRPRTRVQEVPREVLRQTAGTEADGEAGEPGQRVFVIDSDERRAYEQGKREQAMERTRLALTKLQTRVAQGKLKQPAHIGAAAARALQRHHGYRYFDWALRNGVFEFFEHPVHFPREKRLEGKYVIATSMQDIDAQEAVHLYKQLIDVEQNFRQLKDVLALRPIYHQTPHRVRAHIFVAALALLLQCLLERMLQEAGVNLSAAQALETAATIQHVVYSINGQERSGVSTPSARARDVLRALHITDLRPPTPPPDQATRE
jgi:transposase